uniref:Protein BEAN1 n=1 Tax=Petromyzon marinus TaxID=7757 RepID=A0AAJ7X9Y7_PETMA|nr:protein BEAN1 [Petromyzon marinus]
MEISACSFAAFLTFLYQEVYVGWASGLNQTIDSRDEEEEEEASCGQDELRCRDGHCIIEELQCLLARECGWDLPLVCSQVAAASNHSESAAPGFSAAGFGAGGMSAGAAAVAVDGIGVGGAGGAGEGASLLVSPLVVAGMVIGLVLLLSCVTIVAGSLKKDGRSTARGSQLGSLPTAGQDGFSYSGSHGDLSLSRMERYSTAMAYEMCDETVSRLNLTFLDAPPRYEDCIRPSTLILPIPSDAPPPYSLTDPCWDSGLNVGLYPGSAGGPRGSGHDLASTPPASEQSAAVAPAAAAAAQLPIRVFAADAGPFGGEALPVFVSRLGERLWPLRVVDERGVVRMSVSFVAALPPPAPAPPAPTPVAAAAAAAAAPAASAQLPLLQLPPASPTVSSATPSLASVERRHEEATVAGTSPSQQRGTLCDHDGGGGGGGGAGQQEQAQSTSDSRAEPSPSRSLALDQLVPPAYVDAPTYASMPRGTFCILKDTENEYETIPQVIS